MQDKQKLAIRKITESDSRYDFKAYEFMESAVTHTAECLKRAKDGTGRHVTGQELIRGMLDLAREQYGFLAPDVLEYWGIRDGMDAGNIVYSMIRARILAASREDRPEDFDGIHQLPELLRQEILQAEETNS